MNDTDELKARSVELAERAFRMKDKAQDTATKEKLHETGNELIMLDSPRRFYDAQSKLEAGNCWSEDQRSLAHEINTADQNLRNFKSFDIATALDHLENWSDAYQRSSNPETTAVGESIINDLATLNAPELASSHKSALGHLAAIIEAMLGHISQSTADTEANTVVILLRAVRDSLLVARELMYDEDDLMKNYQAEGVQVEQLAIARHSLDELYKTIPPIVLPQ